MQLKLRRRISCLYQKSELLIKIKYVTVKVLFDVSVCRLASFYTDLNSFNPLGGGHSPLNRTLIVIRLHFRLCQTLKQTRIYSVVRSFVLSFIHFPSFAHSFFFFVSLTFDPTLLVRPLLFLSINFFTFVRSVCCRCCRPLNTESTVKAMLHIFDVYTANLLTVCGPIMMCMK